jgi:pimeloyl-ACP methyl ester carboxylesterase
MDLHVSLVAPPTPPTRWMLCLHGILGSGANWRTMARRLVAAQPSWGIALVDLRQHGASQGMPPPHTVRAAALDLEALDDRIPGPIAGIMGHSFGGKVALAYLERRGARLARAWILDAMPGPRPTGRGSETTLAIIDLLGRLGPRFASRQEFVDQAMQNGQDEPMSRWLAMNLVSEGDGFVLRLDLPTIRALLLDYLTLDLWPVIEEPPGSLQLHLVLGGRSRVFDDEERARARQIAARLPDRVVLHTLEKAGHWLHVDDPEGLFAVIRGTM